jgi:hypothetical protein
MAKFSTVSTPNSPIRTTRATTLTHEGAPALVRDAKSELFLLAVTNMVREDTFYETAKTRDSRFTVLIDKVTREDPEWMQQFIPWLRNTAQMRSASVVAAAEYIKSGGPNGRTVIGNTLARADEPAELLAYWTATHGKNYPNALKRGVADSVQSLYNEYSALKYDGQSRDWRMGDVVELVHPAPADNRQSLLYKYLLDQRHHNDGDPDGRTLKTLKAHEKLMAVPAEQRREFWQDPANQDLITQAGVNWEWLSSWIPGGMDKAAWEGMIPHMGYMALLRNLRNFDEVGISKQLAKSVADRLTDPVQVAKSRQFPYRFWSAYKAAGANWQGPLATALQHSTRNVPTFDGRTLVLTDTSGSMGGPTSANTAIRHFEVAGLFAAALTAKNEVDLVSFADSASPIRMEESGAVLDVMEAIYQHNGLDGHSTDVGQGLRFYNSDLHSRVVIFSDMQTRPPSYAKPECPVYIFNTGGYRGTPYAVGTDNTYELGGFTDASFRMIPLLERGEDVGWPWEI